MAMPRSTALHMSYSVKAAMLAAVNASISTPVRPVTRHSAVMRTWSGGSGSNSMDTRLKGSGWHSGISSAHRLAA